MHVLKGITNRSGKVPANNSHNLSKTENIEIQEKV